MRLFHVFLIVEEKAMFCTVTKFNKSVMTQLYTAFYFFISLFFFNQKRFVLVRGGTCSVLIVQSQWGAGVPSGCQIPGWSWLTMMQWLNLHKCGLFFNSFDCGPHISSIGFAALGFLCYWTSHPKAQKSRYSCVVFDNFSTFVLTFKSSSPISLSLCVPGLDQYTCKTCYPGK